jgi:acylphosphatase
MQSAVDVIVSGRVQMVMFRDFAQRKAKSLGLVGEVENCADGSVCIRAEGDKEKLEKLVVHLKRGPFLSKVENVNVEWKEPTGNFTSFIIRYS